MGTRNKERERERERLVEWRKKCWNVLAEKTLNVNKIQRTVKNSV